jgi:hypothetical protein
VPCLSKILGISQRECLCLYVLKCTHISTWLPVVSDGPVKYPSEGSITEGDGFGGVEKSWLSFSDSIDVVVVDKNAAAVDVEFSLRQITVK